MYPELIHATTFFGPLTVSSYSFFLLTALLVVWARLYACLCRYETHLRASVLSIAIIVSAIIGARILHILTNISIYQKSPTLMIALDAQGFSLFGAVILASVFGFIASRAFHFPVLKLGDDMMPAIAVSIAIARIGCFLNGCCFGKVSALPWAVRFPLLSDAHLYQISHGQTNLLTSLSVHPIQLYEGFGALLSVLVAFQIQKSVRRPGIAIAVFLAMFSAVRLIIHFFRAFPDSGNGVWIVYPAIYIIIFFFSIMVIRHKLAH